MVFVNSEYFNMALFNITLIGTQQCQKKKKNSLDRPNEKSQQQKSYLQIWKKKKKLPSYPDKDWAGPILNIITIENTFILSAVSIFNTQYKHFQLFFKNYEQ